MSGLVKTQPATPMQIIADATLNDGVPVEKMQALFDLETAYQEREAKKEFAQAMAKFQHECPIIEKADSAHTNKYSKIDRIWRTIRPLIKECGLALTWESCRVDLSANRCYLDGTLYHISGYSKSVHSEIALPEKIKSQNDSQREGSAQTYAKRYALCSILGIQTGEDDDGNGGSTSVISQDMAKELEKIADDAQADKTRFLKWACVNSFEEITTDKYSKCRHALDKKLADKKSR